MFLQYIYTLGLFMSSLLFISLILVFYLCYIMIVCYNRMFGSSGTGLRKLIVLFVIAHPDDECMFFGPSIVSLVKSGCSVYILCLSTGNYEKLGHKRKEELRESCKLLGVPLGNVIIIQHSKLPDNPNIPWNKAVLGSLLLKYIRSLSADLVMSFDMYGISRHSNHISIHEGLRWCGACHVCHSQHIEECKSFQPLSCSISDTSANTTDLEDIARKNGCVLCCMPCPLFPANIYVDLEATFWYLLKKGSIDGERRVYVLETVNVIRKYSSFMDVPSSYIAAELAFVSTYEDVSVIQKAMRAHKSQYVWFRKLYMLFSRYIYINTFKELRL